MPAAIVGVIRNVLWTLPKLQCMKCRATIVRHTQLCVRVDCRPYPNISPTVLFLLWRDVLALRADEAPDFVALQSADAHIADVLMVIRGGRAGHVDEQLRNRVAVAPAHLSAGVRQAIAAVCRRASRLPAVLAAIERVRTACLQEIHCSEANECSYAEETVLTCAARPPIS
jgi:hypothetical protein